MATEVRADIDVTFHAGGPKQSNTAAIDRDPEFPCDDQFLAQHSVRLGKAKLWHFESLHPDSCHHVFAQPVRIVQASSKNRPEVIEASHLMDRPGSDLARNVDSVP